MSSPDDAATPGRPTTTESRQLINGARVGRLVGVSAEGLALVDFEGNPGPGPVPARSFVALDSAQLRAAVEERREAVLLFEDGDPSRPLLVALSQTPSAPSLLEQLLTEAARPEASPEAAEAAAPVESQDANQQERRVLGAQKELVLQVGEASITLRRDGTILLRGVRVESRATGLQLIRGGKIELN